MGATSDTDSRMKFDVFMRELLKGKLAEYPFPDSVQKSDINLPDNGLVYDYFFDVISISNIAHFLFLKQKFLMLTLKKDEKQR